VDKSDNSKFVSRHLSQLKVLARLFEHELDLAKGESVAFDRDLAESMLDTLEIFIEDVDAPAGTAAAARGEGSRSERKGNQQQDKPQVTRLN
jgi:hypothetical protein